MSSVITEFVKQPIVTLLKKFVESWKVWMTVATAFAAAEERVDAMSVAVYFSVARNSVANPDIWIRLVALQAGAFESVSTAGPYRQPHRQVNYHEKSAVATRNHCLGYQ